MYKPIIATIAFLFCATTINAQEQVSDSIHKASTAAVETPIAHETPAQQKFGYLSYKMALEAMPEYARAQKSLAELRITYDNELKRSEEAFNKQFEEYIDGQKSFPENILLKRQKELQQLMEQSVAFKHEAQRLIVQAEVEMMTPVRERLNSILAQIGTKNGLAYILNTDNNTYPFINPAQGIDITDEVMNKIK